MLTCLSTNGDGRASQQPFSSTAGIHGGIGRAAARVVAASLLAIAATGCTTMGAGTGQSTTSNLGANFTWTASSATRGTMVANLSDGESFSGPFFQVTQESRLEDYSPLWNGWGGGWSWHRPWTGWGFGWGGWGPWGPTDEIITHYSGQVLANLQGPGGFMRCNFTLANPSSGMEGGGVGQCQLPSGTMIQAQFPRA